MSDECTCNLGEPVPGEQLHERVSRQCMEIVAKLVQEYVLKAHPALVARIEELEGGLVDTFRLANEELRAHIVELQAEAKSTKLLVLALRGNVRDLQVRLGKAPSKALREAADKFSGKTGHMARGKRKSSDFTVSELDWIAGELRRMADERDMK